MCDCSVEAVKDECDEASSLRALVAAAVVAARGAHALLSGFLATYDRYTASKP